MRSNDTNDRRVGQPSLQQRPLIYARTDTPQATAVRDRSAASREPAANIIRSHVDAIYDGNTTHPTPQTTPIVEQSAAANTNHATPQLVAPDASSSGASNTPPTPAITPLSTDFTATSPYDRTHTATPQPQTDQWKKYHTAWQDYYRQYYERFYLNELQKNKHQAPATSPVENEVASQPEQRIIASGADDESVSKNEALRELRENLRTKMRESASSVRKSRHFVPIAAGIVVLLMFSFLQYNRTMFAAVHAYVSPGNIDPQNIIVDPTVDVQVGPESKLIIPKINVETPVIYGVGPDHNSQMKAMESGVAHFAIPGANSVPGQVGNTVIAGHSSNDVFAPGDYKFIFAQNEKLVEGDTIYMNYGSVRYTYTITRREVVLPTEVNKIVLDTDKPMLTLISCVPLGTADKRLLIFAEQVSPSPDGATAAPEQSPDATESAPLPSNDPTFLERLFGA